MGHLETYFEILILIARADGRVSPEELRSIEEGVLRSGLAPDLAGRLRAMLSLEASVDRAPIFDSAKAHMSPSLLCEILRDGYAIASIDGEVAPSEVAVLDDLLHRLGYPEGRRAVLLQWGRMAANQLLDGLHLVAETTPE